MSRWKGRHDRCPHCLASYEQLKTGMTFRDVRMLLWVASDVQQDWRYKRRGGVLGLWHGLKVSMWKEHLALCEMVELARQEAALDEQMLEKLPEERAELDRILSSYDSASCSAGLVDVPF